MVYWKDDFIQQYNNNEYGDNRWTKTQKLPLQPTGNYPFTQETFAPMSETWGQEDGRAQRVEVWGEGDLGQGEIR